MLLFLFICISLFVHLLVLPFQANQKQNKKKIHSKLRLELILQLGIYWKDFGFI